VAKRRETLDDLLLNCGQGYTAFAKRAGIPPFTLRRLRSGDIATPRIATLTKLAKALDVSPARIRAAIAASRAAKSD
jgi:predicted transcriptional regulator